MSGRNSWLRLGLLAALALSMTACGASMLTANQRTAAESRAEEVIDAWHAAAARSDLEMYIGLMAEDAVFLGTDASERWDRPAFRLYAEPIFADGGGWSMTSRRRTVEVDPHGRLAWFEEDLTTENLGPARGSGVLRHDPEGWRIVQYNLAITVPNDRFDEVRTLLAGPPAAPAAAD